ncbi:DUF5590 domain-containing protein [Peribacillus alkalitolerans]|uniref:cell wall elongation regulator TseB-like domain-containing protein n=1 Tax=Peribacillus alkalitolerans TaxID=1550385 RepID=UPI0013CFD8D7|nr:DUF5590 domain-containing protein [Peribacillus alkalitolerans]
MKKWLVFIGIAVFLIVALIINSYIQGINVKKEHYNYAVSIAKKDGKLVEINQFHLYNGMETYYVVQGIDENGKGKTVWIPENKKKEITILYNSNGKSKEDIVKIVNKELNPYEIIAIKPGMEKDTPLWEVTFKDEKGRFSYYYFDFRTGEWLKFYRSI